MKYFFATVIALVVVAVGVGLWYVGSPATERLRRFDSLRVTHLQSIQGELYNYWNTNKKLPESLAVFDGKLTNGWSTFIPSVDPATGAAYEYTKKAEDTFVLCATFVTVSDSQDPSLLSSPYPPSKAGIVDSWAHGVGKTCFERTFDKANWVVPTVFPGKD